MHALLRVSGGYEAALEKEAHVALQRLEEDLEELIEDDETKHTTNNNNMVPLLQRATIGLIFRYITHSDLDTRLRQGKRSEQHAAADDDDDERQRKQPSSSTTIAPASMLSSYLQSITAIRMIILAQSRSVWFLVPRWCYRCFSSMYKQEEQIMEPIRQFSSKACESAKPGSPLAALQEHSLYAPTSQGDVHSKNLLDEAVTLLFAGQDTSAATLSWTLHLLSLYPAIQTKLAAEVRATLGSLEKDVILSKKLIAKLPYLDAVIKESMRLYPVAPFIVRKLTSDMEMRDETDEAMTLPKDSFACLWIYSMHRHPSFWKSPNDFIPERWLANQKSHSEVADEGISNGAYMPFAAGPRNCVGQPLAHLILRIFLARLVDKYEFVDERITDNEEDPSKFLKDMQAGFTVLPQGGLHLRVTRRHADTVHAEKCK